MTKYAIITPARNEEINIVRLYESMAVQTQLPEKWVIVNDGSSDRTAKIIDQYAVEHEWIEVVHRPEHIDRNFAGKVHAFNAGFELVQQIDYNVVGNMDSDTSIDPDYMEFMMDKMGSIPRLGVCGSPFKQDDGYDSARDSFEGGNYVSGGCQLFRKECFEEIGGYVPNARGGIDWIAVMKARMAGWQVICFQEKRYHHYRPLGTAETSRLGALYDYGERAYFLGGSPIWQLFRATYRMKDSPYIIGGMILFWGYLWASVRRVKRPVSREMIRYNRRDQMRKLRAILGAVLTFRKVDSFTLSEKASQQNSQ